MPSRQKNRVAWARFGKRMFVKGVLEKYSFVLQPPQPARKSGAIAVHDLAGQHVHRDHDHQIWTFLGLVGASERHRENGEKDATDAGSYGVFLAHGMLLMKVTRLRTPESPLSDRRSWAPPRSTDSTREPGAPF